MDGTRKVNQVFYNTLQRSRLRGRPRNRWWNCVQTNNNKCKIKNWKRGSKNRAKLEKSIKEAKVIEEEDNANGAE